MNPGRSAHRTGVLSQAVTRVDARSTTDGSVRSAATISTSAMTGAGLKKWSPRTRSGPGRRCRYRSDRQRARIRRQEHLRPAGCVEGAEDRPLELEILERRLDHDAGLRTDGIERVRVTKPGQPTGDPFVDAVRVEVQARGSASEAVADPGPTSRDRGLVDVVQDDLVPVLERQLGDPRAHRARPDDSDDRAAAPAPRQTGLKPSNGWRQAVQW